MTSRKTRCDTFVVKCSEFNETKRLFYEINFICFRFYELRRPRVMTVLETLQRYLRRIMMERDRSRRVSDEIEMKTKNVYSAKTRSRKIFSISHSLFQQSEILTKARSKADVCVIARCKLIQSWRLTKLFSVAHDAIDRIILRLNVNWRNELNTLLHNRVCWFFMTLSTFSF